MNPSTSKPLSQVVHEVRDYIAEHGWTRDCYMNEQGNVCFLGGFIATQIPGALDVADVDVDGDGTDVNLIEALFNSSLGIDFYNLFAKVTEIGSVTQWNDSIAVDQEHVIQTLKEMEARCADD